MNIVGKMFEVRVKVGQKLKSYLYEASNNKQAASKAKRHGRIISVRKVDIQALLGRIENISLDQEPERHYLGGGIYEDQLNIDEVLGLSKKTKRRSNDGRTYKDIKEE